MGELSIFCAGIGGGLPGNKVKNVLISAPEAKKNIEKYKKQFQQGQVEKRMLDSGGFQLYLAEEKNKNQAEKKKISFDSSEPLIHNGKRIDLAPEHVIEVAEQMNADFVIGLDFPIRKLKDLHDQDFEFRSKLGFNMLWAREISMLKQARCPEKKLLLPIQCYDLQQLDVFLQEIQSVQYDGFSMPIRNLSAIEVALCMVRFYKLGIRYVHLLGTCEFSRLVVAAYMARHFFDGVSLDSTTWRESATHSKYLSNHNLAPEDLSYGVAVDKNVKLDCKCPHCKGETFTSIRDKNFGEEYYYYCEKYELLRNHNFWVTENVAETLLDKSVNAYTLLNHVRRVCNNAGKVNQLSRLLPLLEFYVGAGNQKLQELEEELQVF